MGRNEIGHEFSTKFLCEQDFGFLTRAFLVPPHLDSQVTGFSSPQLKELSQADEHLIVEDIHRAPY